jgi:hypothetical protein
MAGLSFKAGMVANTRQYTDNNQKGLVKANLGVEMGMAIVYDKYDRELRTGHIVT